MKNKIKSLFIIFALLISAMAFPISASAATPTDEITSYEITIDVQEDGTLLMHYHIDWLVLESDSIGPLEWVNVGIPNVHYLDYYYAGDNISKLSISGTNARIDFNTRYYEGDTASFDFYIVQDYMYQVNQSADGYTDYSFTPGWFDEIEVDSLIIRWNNENTYSWAPSCFDENGYLTWETSLEAGEKYTISVTYPNDAYNFDMSKTFDSGYYDDYDSGGTEFTPAIAVGVAIVIFIILFTLFIIYKIIRGIFRFVSGSGFKSADQKKQVTRTKVEYYANCPRCAGPRAEGETVCSYCGGSLVKSEEVITEKELKTTEKEANKFDKDGEYSYTTNPNVFIRVHTVVPPPRPGSRSGPGSSSSRSSRSSSSSRRSGGGGRSGGGCACASSCACACACACAGGGRAGCTNKDFYNTNLKLKQLEIQKKKQK